MPELIYTSDYFTFEESYEINLAGYIILTLKQPCNSLAELDDRTAALLGQAMKTITAVIKPIIKPERIYTLSFGEVNPQLHFHIFPRKKYLFEQYWQPLKYGNISGPLLLAWTLRNYQPQLNEDALKLQVREALILALQNKPC